MHARSIRRQAVGLAGGLLLTTLSLPALAASGSPTDDSTTSTQHATFWQALELKSATQANVWTRLKSGFELPDNLSNPRVKEWLDYFAANPQYVSTVARNARPWLRWVTRQLEARDMPTELALLPFIESAYDPTAKHPGGASGLWQFMPRTGDAMGLNNTWWYAGRRDVMASTKAALDYLQTLARQWYEGDLELALAAYNAGAGTVNRARKRAAAQGKPIDYWHLSLPKQTMDYVPKLLALAAVISAPQRYGVTLPDIPDRPAIAQVTTKGQLSLNEAARLAGVSEQRLRRLNPALRREATRPTQNAKLVIPAASRQRFLANLDTLPPEQRRLQTHYVVKRGDTLSGIAARHDLPISVLRQQNHLDGDLLRVGQSLIVPTTGQASRLARHATTHEVTVKPGDSLSRIAARHDVSVDELARWNRLDRSDYLHPGQRLTLRQAPR
ncbi:membrane-bound lytic murein transglycosylase D [Chromohalobacter marismortui]|uniref:Membrane-bound lytic murein transglycosylase D n=1 Tax=Chromohalobacter marismortui TaxID=42055 RepID=A0A4R7NPE1_9GAMM|nr:MULTISPECIES: LysM peptidoglycan-binding domain-containing protein [Chromohalobacter]MCI0508872.1 LysM peptidoglycan-binding domain-containing protein [Chromohalobacter sp.]MCI0594271.1 LysM peptidoglycan-binding domain-containing protein [Chromohalobacter sp.]TDU22754.1 membrane-bound lytic murein transglycosylase D [Chromohalobacter marismortui]